MIRGLVGGARSGDSGALVLAGEAGIGKSALLDWAGAAATAEGMRVLRGIGVENEAEIPFAALHLLFRHVLDDIDSLPAPQAEALRSAFGGTPPVVADRFQAGLATLGLLTELARSGPVLCLVDDVHRVDRASAGALAFAARRLGSEGIAIMFALRDEGDQVVLEGLPELRPGPLDAPAARRLLAEHAAELPAEKRDRLIERAAGNPLALRELAVPDGPPSGLGAGRVRQAFRERLARLPEHTRTLLAVAAADDSGELRTLAGAARSMDVPIAALEAAEHRDLVEFTATEGIRFQHPLIRAAAHESAPLALRLAAHHALADVYGRHGDMDRRAWHLAASVIGADESIAMELEKTGARAAGRDAHRAAAEAYERAAHFSSTPADKARRLVAAGEEALAVCLWDRADRMAGRAADICDSLEVRTRTALIRAAVESERGSPRTAGRILLDVAETGGATDTGAVAPLLGEASFRAWIAGDIGLAGEVVARFDDLDPPPDRLTRFYEGTGRAFAALCKQRSVTALRILRETVPETAQNCDARLPLHMPLRLRMLAAETALVAGFDETAAEIAAGLAADCRCHGVTLWLPSALRIHAQAQLFLGRHDEAAVLAEEAVKIARDVGQRHTAGQLGGVPARIAAIRGDVDRCLELAAEGFAAVGNLPAVADASTALALLDIGAGRYAEAADRLHDLHTAPAGRTMAALFALPDHVEAAVRAGLPDRASGSLTRWDDYAEHCDGPWARAVAARCRALMSDDDTAEAHYAEAMRAHRSCGRPFERARTALLYGEWLRRARRRTEARAQLRTALTVFGRLNAEPWTRRARAELRAAGGDARRHADALRTGRLTAQELQVVRMAAGGASNKDIGARLFLSHRTVAYHLYKAFPKLGITSRAQLQLVELDDR